MTTSELKTLLEGTGLPVAYRAFEATAPNQVQAPPFIVFYEDAVGGFYADNKLYYGTMRFIIELVTKRKSKTNEQKVETALAGIPSTKAEAYLDGEHATEITYTIEV